MTRRVLVVLATAGRGAHRSARRIRAHDARPSGSAEAARSRIGGGQQPRRADRRQRQHQHRQRRQPRLARSAATARRGAGNTPTQLGHLAGLPRRRDRQGHARRSTPTSARRSTRRSSPRVASRTSASCSAPVARRSASARRTPPRPPNASRATCSRRSRATAAWPTSRSAGTPLPLDSLVDELTKILNPLLGALVEIKVDERIQTADSLTINALHIKVIKGAGPPLIDLVVGQAKVGTNGDVCDPSKQNDGSGDPIGQVCPPGSTLDRRPQRLRHPGRHERLEPRRDRHRAAVPGPERWHRRPDRRRPQALRQQPVPRLRRSTEVRDRRHQQRRPDHRHEHRRPDHRPRRQRPPRRRPRQRLHRGSHRRRQHLRRPGQRQAVRQLGQGSPQRRSRHRLHVRRRRQRHDQRRVRPGHRHRRRGRDFINVATAGPAAKRWTAARAATSPASTTTSASA